MADEKGTATKPESGTFACPKCGKRFRWKPELAGRKFRCSGCGETSLAPKAAGEVSEAVDARRSGARSGAGEAADRGGGAGVARAGRDGDGGRRLGESRSGVAAKRGKGGVDVESLASRGGYVAPRSFKVAVEEAEETTAINNWVLPLIVLGGGVVWRTTQVLSSDVPTIQATGLVIGEWLFISALVAGATLGAMALMEIELGKLVPGLLKVCGTALLMASVAHFARGFDVGMGDWLGLSLGIMCVLLLGFFMFAAMFRSDLLEGLGATVMVTIGAVVAMLILGAVVTGPAQRVLALGSGAAGS